MAEVDGERKVNSATVAGGSAMATDFGVEVFVVAVRRCCCCCEGIAATKVASEGNCTARLLVVGVVAAEENDDEVEALVVKGDERVVWLFVGIEDDIALVLLVARSMDGGGCKGLLLGGAIRGFGTKLVIVGG